jgi:hypothetical protein
MEKCFVIQPFDGGVFDQRFIDVFKQAIEKADFEAYRVDMDSSVRVPIEDIERGIMESAICFAEITTDNPNVWYELGYAFACGKDVVMVCSDERKDKFPFDIQHKKVIKYTAKSRSNFDKLESDITNTIKAYQKTSKTTHKFNVIPVQETDGLTGHEIAVLILLMEKSISNDNIISFYVLQENMWKSGYTNIATSIAIRTLAKKNMLEISRESNDYDGELFDACKITIKGEDWIMSNTDKLQFRQPQKSVHENDNLIF